MSARSKEPYWVVKYGSDEDVAKWLATGGHIDDFVDPVKKETAMHVAVGGPGSDRVKLLLSFKPDLSIRDAAGRTPMDVATEELKYFRRTQRIGLPNAEARYALLKAVTPDSWLSRIEQESLLPPRQQMKYKDPHRPGRTQEERDASMEKGRWRALVAERKLAKQAKAAKESGDMAKHEHLKLRSKRAGWVASQIEEAMIGYVIGDDVIPPDYPPKAPRSKTDLPRY